MRVPVTAMLLLVAISVLPLQSADAQGQLQVLDANGTQVGVVFGAAGMTNSVRGIDGMTSPIVALTVNGVTFGLRVRQAVFDGRQVASDGSPQALYFTSGDCTGPP